MVKVIPAISDLMNGIENTYKHKAVGSIPHFV